MAAYNYKKITKEQLRRPEILEQIIVCLFQTQIQSAKLRRRNNHSHQTSLTTDGQVSYEEQLWPPEYPEDCRGTRREVEDPEHVAAPALDPPYFDGTLYSI